MATHWAFWCAAQSWQTLPRESLATHIYLISKPTPPLNCPKQTQNVGFFHCQSLCSAVTSPQCDSDSFQRSVSLKPGLEPLQMQSVPLNVPKRISGGGLMIFLSPGEYYFFPSINIRYTLTHLSLPT